VSKQAFAILGANSIYEGAGSRIRTDDLLITISCSNQLSYAGAAHMKAGLESSSRVHPEDRTA
jgi:hypothetical protein